MLHGGFGLAAHRHSLLLLRGRRVGDEGARPDEQLLK
jgi:hypothetical protein